MTRKILAWFVLFSTFSSVAVAGPGNGLDACTELQSPFDGLSQLLLDPAVSNPPQVQLCHRANNSQTHYQAERTDKAVSELEKFISEVGQSTPRHVEGAYAQALIAEAESVIAIITGGAILRGTVSGGVFTYGSQEPVSNASVTLAFTASDQPYTTHTDQNGFFLFQDLPLLGVFVVSASDGTGAAGSAQGSLLEGESQASALVLIEQPGNGTLQGTVSDPQSTTIDNALVTAIFPETKREYRAKVGTDGYYRVDNVHTDGTVIVIAFDNDTGASASYSSVITPYYPSATVNLSLQTPTVINPELTNGDFTQGLTGWSSSGPIQIVDRNIVFGAQ